MNTVEGIVARAAYAEGTATITVFPLIGAPLPHIDPSAAIDFAIPREEWQTVEGHKAHVDHLVGRGAIIEYLDTPNPRVAGLRRR